MKILMHAIEEESGCTYYRNTLPVRHCYRELSEHGIELSSYTTILDVDVADVFVFQRFINDEFLPNLIKIKDAGPKLVFQTDDDLWHLPTWNPAHKKISYNDRQATNAALDIVDEIITSTQPLADVLGKPNKTTVLPNLIDESCFHHGPSQFDQYRMHETQLKILWAGSASHDGDLEQIINPVLALIKKWGDQVQFIFFGYLPTGLANFVRIPCMEVAYLQPKCEGNILFIPGVPFRTYYDVLMSIQPDIGIAPLNNCEFNLSKSNIKSLEMTLAGAAFVGSDMAPYQWIDHDKNGLLVEPDNEASWYNALDRLISNRSEIKRLQKNAIKDVKEKFSWHSEKRNLWLNAFLKMCEK